MSIHVCGILQIFYYYIMNTYIDFDFSTMYGKKIKRKKKVIKN